jgi:hypothetical protein
MMKGVFWYIRGLGLSGKKECLRNMMRELHLDFIEIQETKMEKFTSVLLDELGGSKQFCWNCLPSKRTIGGILLGVNKDVFDVISWNI